MRLAILATADSVHSWRWVRYFAGRGHEVHWISLAPFGEPAPENVRFHPAGPAPRGPVGLLGAVRRVRRLLREIAPELCHAHYLGTYGLLGALGGVRPFVATAWGSDVLVAGRSPVLRPLVKLILRRADALTCDAYHMRDAMVRLGADARKIAVIFFGTDTVKFRPGLDGSGFRRRFAGDHCPLILSTRSLEPIYDVGTLVRAAPLVLREVPEARFVVVGRGSQREALEVLARELGLGGKLQFAGPVTGEEMPLCLAAADIYVSTSLSDGGLAASTAEAMASELPVVVSDSAENGEWVAEGRGGFLVPVRDPAALAERIVRLARSPEDRKRFGAYNRSVIKERNDYYVEMEKVNRLYGDVVSRFTARP